MKKEYINPPALLQPPGFTQVLVVEREPLAVVVAGGAQASEELPLRQRARARRLVIEPLQAAPHAAVVGADLDRQHALPDGRHEGLRVQRLRVAYRRSKRRLGI